MCLPDAPCSLGERSSKAIHRAEPFAPVVEDVEDDEVMRRDIPKSANRGQNESDIRILSLDEGNFSDYRMCSTVDKIIYTFQVRVNDTLVVKIEEAVSNPSRLIVILVKDNLGVQELLHLPNVPGVFP